LRPKRPAPPQPLQPEAWHLLERATLKRPSTLQLALGISLALHGLLLAVRLADPARFDRIFEDTPLEVILVNSQTKARPEQAKAIAQFSLAGGGTLDKGRASSPLPPAALTDLGEAADAAQRQIDNLQARQMQLLTQLKQQLAALPPPEVARLAKDPADAANEEKRRQLLEILGEIEKRISQENERPQKRYISPATREEAYAIYYDRLRRKIESLGTTAFPALAGQKLYGELTLALTVNSAGQLLVSEVLQSSGNPVLDRQAQSIAARAGPFGRFSPGMLRQADQIVVVSRFTFARDDTLQTRMGAR
jgi:protein TonB